MPLLGAKHDDQASNTILGQKVQNPANWHNATQRERPLDPRGETWSCVELRAEEAPEKQPRIPGTNVPRVITPAVSHGHSKHKRCFAHQQVAGVKEKNRLT